MTGRSTSPLPLLSERRPAIAAAVAAAFCALAAGLVLFALHAFTGFGGGGTEQHPLFDHLIYLAVMVGAALVCLARVVLVGRRRLPWLLIGLGLAAWAIGDAYWIADAGEPPFPSAADASYLAAYPLMIAGLVALLAPRMRRLRASAWLDALLGALAITAIGVTLLLGSIVDATRGWTTLEQAATLAYPIGDVFQLALIGAIVVVTGMAPGRTTAIVIVGLAITAGADAVYSYQEAVGTYVEGTWVDLMWMVAAAMIAFAAWLPDEHRRPRHAEGLRALAAPTGFVIVALAVLGWQGLGSETGLEELTAGLILVVLVLRTIVAFAENHRLLERVRTDHLTGLANRGRLLVDLEQVLARGSSEPHLLVYFDLDGFKLYNDTYGHPAGDALLTRLAARLRAALPAGAEAYRVGGDEFCVLLPGRFEQAIVAVTAASGALRERGAGFEVTSSFGVAEMPAEAATPEAALQLADQRLYAQKDSNRVSPARQAEAVLLRAMKERRPDLGDHGSGVARLASATGAKLGLEPPQLIVLTRAAELHDIGKVAIPDAVLTKPGPLTDEEWEFMRQHTVLGERILLAAPALSEIGPIVRSTHERYDGAGYPDGLAGEAIPLESRIIFVCDAYDAMTSRRPYAEQFTSDDARAELRRCAGSQFDPRVVDALCSVLESGVPDPAPATLTAAEVSGQAGEAAPAPA